MICNKRAAIELGLRAGNLWELCTCRNSTRITNQLTRTLSKPEVIKSLKTWACPAQENKANQTSVVIKEPNRISFAGTIWHQLVDHQLVLQNDALYDLTVSSWAALAELIGPNTWRGQVCHVHRSCDYCGCAGRSWLLAIVEEAQPQKQSKWGEPEQRLLSQLGVQHFFLRCNKVDYEGETISRRLRTHPWMNQRINQTESLISPSWVSASVRNGCVWMCAAQATIFFCCFSEKFEAAPRQNGRLKP